MSIAAPNPISGANSLPILADSGSTWCEGEGELTPEEPRAAPASHSGPGLYGGREGGRHMHR